MKIEFDEEDTRLYIQADGQWVGTLYIGELPGWEIANLIKDSTETRRQRDLLLEAARPFDLYHVSTGRLEELAAKDPVGTYSRYLALRRAIRECEPPKPTREELLERIAEQARQMVNGGSVPMWDQFTQLEESVTELDALDGGGQ